MTVQIEVYIEKLQLLRFGVNCNVNKHDQLEEEYVSEIPYAIIL